MIHLNKFNESKRREGGKCSQCGEKIEMYYVAYCPKCDIQDIIKHKRGSYCLIPILNYGKKYIKGFDKDLIWEDICENLGGNDQYLEYQFDEESEPSIMLKSVLDDLEIECPDNEILFWVSW